MLFRTVIHEIVNHDDVAIGVLNLQELVVGIIFPFKIYGLLGFYLTPAAVFRTDDSSLSSLIPP